MYLNVEICFEVKRRRLENALKNSEYAVNSASSAVDRAQATKKGISILSSLLKLEHIIQRYLTSHYRESN